MGRARSAALLLAGVAGSALALLPATPASADPPRPTNYRSEVLRVNPDLPPGVQISVVGGDAFLELHVPRGHTAVVPDYGEDPADPTSRPYLRFGADGTVERNRHADATAVNDARYGSAAPGADRAPDWEVVATDGTYAWHDHRIHWMSTRAPTAVDEDGVVDLGGPGGEWVVDLIVDDVPTVVRGQLVVLDAPSPLPWLLGVVLVAAGGIAAARRGGVASTVLLISAALAGLAAAVSSWAQWHAAPAGSGATGLGVVIALVASVASIVTLVGPAPLRLPAWAAAAASLIGWAVLRLGSLTRAVLPTPVPGLDRASTAVALGLGVALGVAVVRWPPVRSNQSA